jgi:hypothetical protein
MKHIPVALLMSIAATNPVAAQEGDLSDGLSLMEQGAQLLFRGLMDEMAPTIEEFKGLAEDLEPRFRAFALEMGPAMIGLLDEIDDLRNYEKPTFLPNGDIIMRRKTDAPPFVPPVAEDPAAPGEIEL